MTDGEERRREETNWREAEHTEARQIEDGQGAFKTSRMGVEDSVECDRFGDETEMC